MATDMAILQKTFGERVAERRKELGMTQAELAEAVKTRQSAISALEAGENSPTLDTVEKFAKALKTTPASLLF